MAKLAKSNELMVWTTIRSPRGLQVRGRMELLDEKGAKAPASLEALVLKQYERYLHFGFCVICEDSCNVEPPNVMFVGL